uniref:(3R)-3-hydroxyacyl-CoA dehydrogenase n=1 Tax=Panagrellus redivivus TaxID=6233 RepID=A0A7E4VHR9_PANRE
MLANKVGIVTGGATGLGRAIAQVLAKNGASVVVVDLAEGPTGQTVDLLKKENPSGNHASFIGDVSNRAQVDQLRDFFKSQFNNAAPNFLVNNAGITRDATLLKMSEKQFDDVINVNLKAVWMLSQTFARLAVEAKTSQSIVNISSIVGKTGNFGQTNYAASKAGVIGLSKSAAKELAKHNIRVNAILPGFVHTDMVDKVPPKVLEGILKGVPMRRLGRPEELGNAVAFLCSDLSSFVTGAAIEVTGGLDM